MELADAIKLIHHKSLIRKNSSWIDLGCGNGLFTYALANILPEESTIYAIEKSNVPLTKRSNPNQITIRHSQLDFEKDALNFNNADGILMANSLHYVKDKLSFINRAGNLLAQEGSFLIVEYDTDQANQWVPYPCSFITLSKIFKKAGYHSDIKIGEIPSIFGPRNIYSALFQV